MADREMGLGRLRERGRNRRGWKEKRKKTEERAELGCLARLSAEAADELRESNPVKTFFKVVIKFHPKRKGTAFKAIAY